MPSVTASHSRAPVDPDAALDVRGLTKRFRTRRHLTHRGANSRRVHALHTAVDDVTFRIAQGEIYGVIGSNGSGKSTLIRMLSTLLLPDEGDVFIFGSDAVRDPISARRLINRVSADPSFFRAMSPLENLLFFGRAYGLGGPEVRRRSHELLSTLGLDAESQVQPMVNMSRGQQQKVAVARAFLTHPRLMLLDEPTTGLDPRSKRDVQRYVAQARDDGVSVLLTTHDMEEAEVLCDRIAFLAGGKVVAEGTPIQLRQNVAASGRAARDVDMEEVFMTLTGRRIEEDEEHDDAAS